MTKLKKVTCTHWIEPEEWHGKCSGSFDAPLVLSEKIRKAFKLDRWQALALASLPASVRQRVTLDGKQLP